MAGIFANVERGERGLDSLHGKVQTASVSPPNANTLMLIAPNLGGAYDPAQVEIPSAEVWDALQALAKARGACEQILSEVE